MISRTIVAAFLALLVQTNWFQPSNAAKILFLSFSATKSHQNVYEPLLFELAKRGHDITLVSPVSTGRSLPQNFREIITPNFQSNWDQQNQLVFERQASVWKSSFAFPNVFLNAEKFTSICRAAYGEPQVLQLVHEKFDLIFLKNFLNECTYGLAHALNTTTILTTTFPASRWTVEAFGAFNPPSFVPNLMWKYSDRMNFFQRTLNFVAEVFIYSIRQFLYLPKMESLYREVLGDHIPSAYEIERNASALFINADFTLTYPRPQLPDMIEIGGIHCVDPKPLPQDLEDFISGAGDSGFIYFSLGSVLNSNMMPERNIKAFLSAFSKLKQRVLWKLELNSSSTLEVPANVKLLKWLPQQDVLGHPQILAFITHGGLLSIEEAVYHGVPIIGIPMFGDQPWNVKQADNMGFGLHLPFHATSDEMEIRACIRNIVSNRRYRYRARELSRIFRDKIESPLDKAVFWTEYVLRHNGATHMRSAARELNFVQYHSLDVIAIVTGVTTILLLGIILLLKKLIKSLFEHCLKGRRFTGGRSMVAEKPKSS